MILLQMVYEKDESNKIAMFLIFCWDYNNTD